MLTNKNMNIAIILPTIISKNGTAKQSLELMKELTKKGHSVEFFTFAYSRLNAFPEYERLKVNYCVNVDGSMLSKILPNVAKLEPVYLYLAFFNRYKFVKLIKNKGMDIFNPHDWFGIWISADAKDKEMIVANINDVPDRNNTFFNKIKLGIDRRKTVKIDKIIVLDEKK